MSTQAEPNGSDHPIEVVLVTGMSGAGRSTVANVLEDMDWYVVDNLPPQMMRPLVELVARADGALPKIAGTPSARTWSMRSARARGEGSPKSSGWTAPTTSQP